MNNGPYIIGLSVIWYKFWSIILLQIYVAKIKVIILTVFKTQWKIYCDTEYQIIRDVSSIINLSNMYLYHLYKNVPRRIERT